MIDPAIALAFAGIAVLAFFTGRIRRPSGKVPNPQARRAVARARLVCKELHEIGADIRRDLATHHRSMASFESRLRELGLLDEAWDELSVEAENMLKPTLHLASRIAHAYDNIRQQTHLLMALTEVRTDPLTGLRNRRALDEALNTRVAMLDRYGDAFSVAVFDVDHFKQINDLQGHLEGDRILQEFAKLLDATVRDTDLVTRFGGEEFVIVMPQTDLRGACIFAERTRAAIEERLTVTASVGVTQACGGDDPRRLLSRADEAMYAAKENGRNCVYYTHEELGPQRVAVELGKQDVPAPLAVYEGVGE